MVKALGLFSGGLDSVLAVCVLREQGIAVTGIAFETPFFNAERARKAARNLDIPLIVMDITGPHLEVMKKPKHGFGSNMNPCIDCHVLMVKIARGIMEEQKFDFVFTGEVLNERPMSQNRQSLRIVERESGCEGYLLRPLSAKLLDETIPEKEGRVDREKLLALHGRGRKPQMELAKKYGITGYMQPAGGCLLTDPAFSKKLKDLRDHEGMDDVRGIQLLKVGRHFRLESVRKAIVGRNEQENKKLESLARDGDVFLHPPDVPGPTVILPGGGGDRDITEAAKLCARYSDAEPGKMVAIEHSCGKEIKMLHIPSPAPDDLHFQTL